MFIVHIAPVNVYKGSRSFSTAKLYSILQIHGHESNLSFFMELMMTSSKFKSGMVFTGLMMGLLVGVSTESVQASENGKTRAQVKAELKEALARGEVYFNDVDYPPTPVLKSTKSRDQVRNEVRQAMASGNSLIVDEVNYPPEPVATGPGRSRAEVVAEVMEAKRDGTLVLDEVNYPDNRNARLTVMTAKGTNKVDTANAPQATATNVMAN